VKTPIAHVCCSFVISSVTDQAAHVIYAYIVFFIPLAEQKQIYGVWPIAFGAAILYTEIFLVERDDIYTDRGVENFEFG